jgi:hypothetical protein
MTRGEAPVLSRPPRAGRIPLAIPGRLLRLELRRNAMAWMLPLVAVLFWLDSYRNTLGQPPLWSAQTAITMGQGHALIDFGPFVAGAAAWMGSRDGRHDTTELARGTARSRWSGQLVTWTATTCWALAAYLILVGGLYAVIAQRVGWGGPPWWPVAVGAAGVAAFSALGFAAGAFFPGRFVAPLAACGAFVVLVLSSHAGFSGQVGAWSVLPESGQGGLGLDSGIFYPYLPDLSIARLMFLAGLSVAVLGALGLRTGDGWRLARSATMFTVAGLLAAGTAGGLLSTTRLEAHGVVIPALHDAASDLPISYTPICGQETVPVCLHPAYLSYLPAVTAGLDPVLSEVGGLPGAPVRVAQSPASYLPQEDETISGNPPVLHTALGNLGLEIAGSADFNDKIRLLFLHAFVGAGNGASTPAQQAVQAALLSQVGVPLSAQPHLLAHDGIPGPDEGSPVYPAAQRFALQPAVARHTWLTSHLGALRAGHITLAELP